MKGAGRKYKVSPRSWRIWFQPPHCVLTVHTVSLTFLTTLLAPNKKGWARGGGKREEVGESHIPALTLILHKSTHSIKVWNRKPGPTTLLRRFI